jgi:hypothetical protein
MNNNNNNNNNIHNEKTKKRVGNWLLRAQTIAWLERETRKLYIDLTLGSVPSFTLFLSERCASESIQKKKKKKERDGRGVSGMKSKSKKL